MQNIRILLCVGIWCNLCLFSCQSGKNQSKVVAIEETKVVSDTRNSHYPDGAGSSQSLPAHPLLGAFRLCRHYLGEQPRRDGAGLRELHRPAGGRHYAGGADTREPEELVRRVRRERPRPQGIDPNGGRLPLQPQLAFLQRGALRNVSGGVARQVATDGCDAFRLPF